MEFTIQFYESQSGHCLVRVFLATQSRIIAVHGIRNKGRSIPARDLETANERMRDWRKRMQP
ncbi:MAG: hypothetical protein A3H91_11200 [Gammaproteobacteria bacterium RIFCSPLOWO2_02_FULL_61_13]|nr:MAG: hypothetical protein A3H91_11200 [Gammaproteobacteria bacterium RIFCSPLOWO2_02_FULL_61_13]